jgi:hypothetical protein
MRRSNIGNTLPDWIFGGRVSASVGRNANSISLSLLHLNADAPEASSAYIAGDV